MYSTSRYLWHFHFSWPYTISWHLAFEFQTVFHFYPRTRTSKILFSAQNSIELSGWPVFFSKILFRFLLIIILFLLFWKTLLFFTLKTRSHAVRLLFFTPNFFRIPWLFQVLPNSRLFPVFQKLVNLIIDEFAQKIQII